MSTDFDSIIDRSGTGCIKYDAAIEHGYPTDILPLWVADMDFQAPQPVLDALQEAVSHGVFGYSHTSGDYYTAVSTWFDTHFNWRPEQNWLVKTPGVVYAIAMGVCAASKQGESVMIQPPVYYPFSQVVRKNNRRLIENELVYQNGNYVIDFEDFEQKISEEQVKVFILCSPHNPVGRVWTRAELATMGEICLKHGVIVISDEIHCDFTYPGYTHTMFLHACPDMAESTILCTAPSKTFNLAGLQTSNIWIPGKKLRAKFKTEIEKTGYSQLNNLGLIACKTAYEQGDAWLVKLREYLTDNLNFLRDFLNTRLPEIRLVEPQGTYLVWLDCRGLGLSDEKLERFITDEARLWLDGGHLFGGDSGQFERINIACPRAILENALLRLEQAVKRSR